MVDPLNPDPNNLAPDPDVLDPNTPPPPPEPVVPAPPVPAEPAAPAAPAPAAPAAQLTEEQWVALEKTTGLSRQNILAVNAIAVGAVQNSPQAKIVERETLNEVKGSLPAHFAQHEAAVKAKLANMSVQDRINPEVVRDTFHRVAGAALASGDQPAAPAAPASDNRRISGLPEGGSTAPRAAAPAALPSNLTSDEKEVYARYGIKSKAEFDALSQRDIKLNESDWKPEFK